MHTTPNGVLNDFMGNDHIIYDVISPLQSLNAPFGVVSNVGGGYATAYACTVIL